MLLVTLLAARAAAKPPHRTFAWYHPPKTGTSLGTVIAHAANRSLPPCARVSTCERFAPAKPTVDASLHHPYAPHRCYGATDRFLDRFPRDVWFRGVSFVPGPPRDAAEKWGDHARIDDETFAAHRGSFYGLFRSPPRLAASNYIRWVEIRECGGTAGKYDAAAPGGYLTRPECHDSLNFSAPTGVRRFVAYVKANYYGLMTHHLLKQVRKGQPPGHDFAGLVAKRLDGFKFVGLTDEWATSICLFHQIHGGYRCSPAEFVNSRPTATAPPDYDGIFRRFGLRDEQDEVVYAAARARFKKDLRKWNVTSETCKRLQCTDASWPRDRCPMGDAHT